jgi:hypothetical protein
VVALSHINVSENEEIAGSVEGIAAIVDPFSQFGSKTTWVPENRYFDYKFAAPIVRIDGQGSRVGVFEMYFEGEASRYSGYRGYEFPLEQHIYSHPELEKIVTQFYREKRELPADFDPRKVHLLTDQFLGQETCGACHEKQHEFWLSTEHSRAYSAIAEASEGEDGNLQYLDRYTLGYGLTFVDPDDVGEYKNVQCENCHGVEPRHAEEPADYKLGPVQESRCWGCHNESITKKPFNMATDKPKVACPKMESY